MPLLGKEEFTLKTLPPNLDPNTEVFYCNITGEAFLNYDDYFERQILCSSLLWTCSITGKSGLTYVEALKSERESQTLLSSVPRVLQKILLHLMKYMDNFSTNVVLAILLEYTNLRYFIGENVQVMSQKTKRSNGIIRDVIPPDVSEVTSSIAYGIDPLKYRYAVEIIEHSKKNMPDRKQIEIVPASRISRPKTMITREKLRLFLKQHLSPKSGRYDTLSIKAESIHKFRLDHIKWEDIFKGPTPNFNDDTTLVKAFNKRQSDAIESEHNKSNNDVNHVNEAATAKNMQIVKKKSNMLTDQKLKRIQREEKMKEKSQNQISVKEKKKGKKLKLKDKAKLKGKKLKKLKGKKDQSGSEEQNSATAKLDKIEEKKKIKEARRKFEEGTRSWMEKRDDLLCDDLQTLPKPTPVACDIDANLFGESLVILEFINIFNEFINDFPNVFQGGISIDLFAEILNDSDVNGPYSDLLQILLDTILLSHCDDEEGDLNINKANEEFNEDDDLYFYNSNFSNHYVTTYFATHENLAKLKLDAFSLTEILRIYLLKVRNSDLKRSRHSDDQQDISLAIKLTACSVYDLNQTERIILLNLLMNDLVKVPRIRQKIEESMEEIFRFKAQIRHLNASFTKWLRDNPIRQRIRKKKQTTDGADNKEAPAEPQENEATQAEKETYKREKTQKEQQMKKSISELKAKIRKLSAFCRPRPLGLDRAYRRYWVFQSVPGLLVEHSVEEMIRPCFESPVPMPKPQLSNYLPNAKKRKRKTMSKKEGEEAENAENDSQNDQPDIFCRCTGDLTSCSVHGAANTDKRVRWAFYTKEQLDELLEALNSRGFRENELKNALNFEKNSILKNHLEKFVPTVLNPSYEPPPVLIEEPEENLLDSNLVRKSERIQNQIIEKVIQAPKVVVPVSKHLKVDNQYSKLPPTEALVMAFRDEMLAFEDRISNGCFTSFEYAEREEWKRNVESASHVESAKSIEKMIELFRKLTKYLRPFCLLPPLSVIRHDASASSPSDKENIEHIQPTIPKLSEKWFEVVKVAAGAFTGELVGFESSFGLTNFSQLFVNMYILDKSINWELSAMKTATRCRVCRRKANNEMVLCDKCNKGYHVYCLKPPIASVNDIEGDWFCYTCVPRSATSKKNIPQQKMTTIPKEELHEEKHYNGVEVSDCTDESFESTSGNICSACRHDLFDEYNEVLCKSCNRSYHLSCVNLLRVPRSWSCLPCEDKERYNHDHSDEGGDLRRSSRKRKPNHYYDDPNHDETYHPSNGSKAKRLS